MTSRVRPRYQRRGGPGSGVELGLAFVSDAIMGILHDRWLIPPLVDAWIDRKRRQGR